MALSEESQIETGKIYFIEEEHDDGHIHGASDFNLTGSRWVDRNAAGAVEVTYAFTSPNASGQFSRPENRKAVADAFAAWEAVGNLKFVRRADGTNADIELFFENLGGPGGTLGVASWTSRPGPNFSELLNVDVSFDVNDFDRGSNISASEQERLFVVALHEIGHAIGLAHSDAAGAVMRAFLSRDITSLSDDDIAAVRAIYGPATTPAPNPTPTPTPTPPSTPNTPTDGNDVIVGTAGRDVIAGRAGNDTISGQAGNDQLDGDGGNDTLNGGNGNDTLNGGAGSDFIRGGAGNDVIAAGPGNDWNVFGGTGQDTFVMRKGDGRLIIRDFENGTDKVKLEGGLTLDDVIIRADTDRNQVYVTFSGSDEKITFANTGPSAITLDDFDGPGSGGGSQGKIITGDNGANRLNGTSGDDRIDAKGGSDFIRGGDGDDVIIAGTGNDWNVYGDAGSDTFIMRAGDDRLIIRDFAVDEDILRLEGGISRDDVRLEANASGNQLYIKFNNSSDQITLANLNPNDVSLDDLVFA